MSTKVYKDSKGNPVIELAEDGDPTPDVANRVKEIWREKAIADGAAAAGIDAETWALITAARKEEQDAEAEVDGLKEALKCAKERLDVASAKLGRLIDEATEPGLFNEGKAQ